MKTRGLRADLRKVSSRQLLKIVQGAFRVGWGCGHDPPPEDGQCLHVAWYAARELHRRAQPRKIP